MTAAHADELLAWARAHGIAAMVAPLARTTAAWIASAAPRDADDDKRVVACIDLAACFFVIDDSPRDDALARVADLERALAGAPGGRPLQRALAALVRELEARGAPLAHYRAVRVAYATAMRVRFERGATLDSDAWLALRLATIYFEPWLSTWEILDGAVLDGADRARVAPVVAHACRWQVLENELVSLARDRAARHPNLVALVAAERGLDLATASADVAARARTELAALDRALAAIAGPSPALARSVATIVRAVDGARAHHVAGDPARYVVAT
jgi:hypothetical protein|nr:hypothetical protein [Kofleriaceae bacterium]